MSNLTQELGDVNPAFRAKLHLALENLIRAVVIQLEEASARGELSARIEPEATALHHLGLARRGGVRMKAVAGPEPLDNFQTMVFQVLLA